MSDDNPMDSEQQQLPSVQATEASLNQTNSEQMTVSNLFPGM